MVLLRFVSGRFQGRSESIRRFPAIIGRCVSSNLRIEENGVWDRHFEIDLKDTSEFRVRALANAKVYVNGDLAEESVLRVGDVVQAGSCKVEFSLDRTQPNPLGLRETLVYVAFGVLLLSQLSLVIWILK